MVFLLATVFWGLFQYLISHRVFIINTSYTWLALRASWRPHKSPQFILYIVKCLLLSVLGLISPSCCVWRYQTPLAEECRQPAGGGTVEKGQCRAVLLLWGHCPPCSLLFADTAMERGFHVYLTPMQEKAAERSSTFPLERTEWLQRPGSFSTWPISILCSNSCWSFLYESCFHC